jgi:ATPase family associated with various cellular activities (AAA)
MNTSDRLTDWTAANQRLLVAEFGRLKQRLGGEGDAGALMAAVDAARAAMPAPAAIDHLTRCFGLSPFERDLLLLCAGAEMDTQLTALCESAAGESHRAGVTFGLSLAVLDAAHWDALAQVRPLRHWRLLERDESLELTRGPLRIDERILHYLAGANYLDARLRSLTRPAPRVTAMATTHRGVVEDICNRLATWTAGDAPLVRLTGDDAPGQADVAVEVASALGFSLYVLQASDIPGNHAEAEAMSTLWGREARLLEAALLVSAGADALPTGAMRILEHAQGLIFLSSSHAQPVERAALRSEVNKPEPPEQKQLWQQALGHGMVRLNGSLDGLAGQFRLSARTIQAEAAYLSPALGAAERPDQVVWSACRKIARMKLDDLAQRIEPAARWDDLILPEAQKFILRQIEANVRNRSKVHLDWGFADGSGRGLGISALFAGESGTGKTMAAEVVAFELQLDLYRIDLSAVVSKYIGETEKNLRRVFNAAEESGAILLFDEADALFGKRSEVKDSHDRYANIEVSYLLQRMEAYRGVAILTSNHKGALDSAFLRRLRFIVHFAFPDQAMREAIWRRAFPAAAPLHAIDYGRLSRLNVTGGGIRNIAINAAFRAAELEEPVSMQHLFGAAHHEANKRERPLSNAETQGWV